MSQYQQVTNHDLDPHCYRSRRYTWGVTLLGQRADGRWSFGDRGNSFVGLLHEDWSVAAGNVVVSYLEFGTTVTNTHIRGARTELINQPNGTHLLLVGTDIVSTPQVCINGLVSCTPLYAAILTPQDWSAVQNAYDAGTIGSLLWTPQDIAGGSKLPPLLGA